MPKDQWAIDRAIEMGRDAARTGEFFRKGDPGEFASRGRQKKSRKRKSRKQSKREEQLRSGICPKCRIGGKAVHATKLTPRRFENGTEHFELRCHLCDSFVKWLAVPK